MGICCSREVLWYLIPSLRRSPANNPRILLYLRRRLEPAFVTCCFSNNWLFKPLVILCAEILRTVRCTEHISPHSLEPRTRFLLTPIPCFFVSSSLPQSNFLCTVE
jgi:hypothetical protein